MSSGDRKLPLNRRQHVFPNGTLLIENVQRAGDHGLYTCTATNKQHLAASQTVSLSVIGECVLEQRTNKTIAVCGGRFIGPFILRASALVLFIDGRQIKFCPKRKFMAKKITEEDSRRIGRSVLRNWLLFLHFLHA